MRQEEENSALTFMDSSAKKNSSVPQVGVVVIGRNEGAYLETALDAVIGEGRKIVYVDSGSTDESVAIAHRLNIPVIELDPARPFTAARAYNEGFELLLLQYPTLAFVQFVDGDCFVHSDWIEMAVNTLSERPKVAILCGHLREQHRDRSIYHVLMDIEWTQPVGAVEECAGNAMMRASAFAEVGGFNEQMMAGEEPELSLRMRQAGWQIWRIDADAASHNSCIDRFSQWWDRCRREGNAYAEAAWLHGFGAENHRLRHSLRVVFWGLLPFVAVGLATYSYGWSLLLLLLYVPLWIGVFVRSPIENQLNRTDAALYASFCVLGKFPQLLGQLNFFWHLIQQKTPRLIEYRLGSAKK